MCSTYLKHLDSSILPQDPNLEVQGYMLIQVDHPSNVKQVGVYLLQKPSPLKTFNINYLQECITFELGIKTYYALLLHF